MGGKELKSCILVALICAGTILPVYSAPSSEGRKYLVKSNTPKKVYHKQMTSIVEHQQAHQQVDQTNMLMVRKFPETSAE